MSTQANTAAFPITNGILDRKGYKWQGGLSKREYFAAMALQGLLADSTVMISKSVATDAVKMADHLINALNE